MEFNILRLALQIWDDSEKYTLNSDYGNQLLKYQYLKHIF